jgi:hypothetical protein
MKLEYLCMDSTSIVAEEPPDSDTLLDTTVTVPGLCFQEAMKHNGDTIQYNAVGMKEDAAAFEPAIWEDTEVAMLDDDTPWKHRAPCLQRSGIPYPFRRVVCPPFPSLSIARSSFPYPVTATKMPIRLITANADFSSILSSQIATPVLSRDGNLKKQDVSREDEPIVDMFKRRTT